MMTILVQFGLAVAAGIVLGVTFCITKFVVDKLLDIFRRNDREDFH